LWFIFSQQKIQLHHQYRDVGDTTVQHYTNILNYGIEKVSINKVLTEELLFMIYKD